MGSKISVLNTFQQNVLVKIIKLEPQTASAPNNNVGNLESAGMSLSAWSLGNTTFGVVYDGIIRF